MATGRRNSKRVKYDKCEERPDSSSQLNDIKEFNTLTPELGRLVFGNESILDKIFDNVFFDNEEMLMNNILTCRQVQRSWLEYATHRLQKTGKAIFTVDFFHWADSRKIQNREEMRYQIRNFIDTWVNVPEASSRLPMFNLIFSLFKVKTKQNCLLDDFSAILMTCGKGLHTLGLKLNYEVRKDVHNFKKFANSIRQLHLPTLKNLRVELPRGPFDLGRVNLMVLPILSSCTTLHCLSLEICNISNQEIVPFDRIFSAKRKKILPEMLVKIKLFGKIGNLLIKNYLPNLAEVELNCDADNKEHIVRILYGYCGQLKAVTLYGFPPSRDSTLIAFPVMAKLEYLVMNLYVFYLDITPGMEQPFPLLDTLQLTRQRNTMFDEWTENYLFPSAKSVTIEILPEFDDCSEDVIFTLDQSRQLHTSFSHVLELDLTISCLVEEGSIGRIFQKMTQLQKLSLRISDPDKTEGTLIWDSILLGVDLQVWNNLVSNQDNLDAVNLNEYQLLSKSITNLTELTSLTLKANKYWFMSKTLISDLSFRFGFLCMPHLYTLNLTGHFQASEKMTQEWRRQGRLFHWNQYPEDASFGGCIIPNFHKTFQTINFKLCN